MGDQSRDPSCHSCRSPSVTRSKNGKVPRRREAFTSVARRVTVGRRITTSTSKTKKITARRKNRVEKGSRAERWGSNPHSNGDCFSRLLVERALRITAKVVKRRGNSSAINMERTVRLTGVCLRQWKSDRFLL